MHKRFLRNVASAILWQKLGQVLYVQIQTIYQVNKQANLILKADECKNFNFKYVILSKPCINVSAANMKKKMIKL